MGRPEDAKLTPDTAREVCLRTNSKAVVIGSIADVGNLYRITLKAFECQTQEWFAATEKETPSRDEVVKTLGAAGADFRRKLGEPNASLQRFNQPLEQATSSSVEALQALALGLEQKRQHGDAAALPYFKSALDVDANFAEAYAALGAAYRNLNETKSESSVQNLRAAFDLHGRVTQRQRFFIDGTYFWIVTGEFRKAIQTFTDWINVYPKDPVAHYRLSAVSMEVGEYEKAAAEARESIRLLPTAAAYLDEASSFLRMNKLEEAKKTLAEAESLKIVSSRLPVPRYKLAFLSGDRLALDEQVKSATPNSRGLLLYLQSFTEAFYGSMRRARQLSQQLTDLAKQTHSTELAAECRSFQALQEAEIGNSAEAQRQAAAALAQSTSRDTKATAALAFARAGALEEAENLSQQLRKDCPEDTLMQNYSLPTIEAAIKLRRGDPGAAVDILQAALPYEMGFASFEYLYPAYVRGEAYLKANNAQKAADEFQKMIDHPGIMENYITGALAHLQLGRAQAMMGDKAAARKSYQDFLTLWKEADPDIPIYQQAKAEYTKLR
jgi:tetratricopeptide (TPR) repeat protein